MNLSKSDTRELLRLLDESSKIIGINQQSTKEANIARRCRRLRKKLIRQLDYDVRNQA